MAFYTSLVEEQRDAQLAEAERIVGGLFESMSEKTTGIPFTNVTMTSPEVAFISILRYGMLALELLPEKSSSGSQLLLERSTRSKPMSLQESLFLLTECLELRILACSKYFLLNCVRTPSAVLSSK